MGIMPSDGRFNHRGNDHVSDYSSDGEFASSEILQPTSFGQELDTYLTSDSIDDTTRYPDLIIDIPTTRADEVYRVPPELETTLFKFFARDSMDWVCSLLQNGLVFSMFQDDERISNNCKELKILLGSSFLGYFLTDDIVKNYLDLYYLVDAYSIILANYQEDSTLDNEISSSIIRTVDSIFAEFQLTEYTRPQVEDEIMRVFNALAIFRANKIQSEFDSDSKANTRMEFLEDYLQRDARSKRESPGYNLQHRDMFGPSENPNDYTREQ